MGCASIPMQDGGVQAHAIMQRLRERYLCTEHLRAEPKKPLPTLDIPSNVIAEMPPLLKAYMRLGAKICGEPCWDEDFQVADVFILLKRDELCPRYAATSRRPCDAPVARVRESRGCCWWWRWA
jgi:putative hemolysin